jgi:hypothetical protein
VTTAMIGCDPMAAGWRAQMYYAVVPQAPTYRMHRRKNVAKQPVNHRKSWSGSEIKQLKQLARGNTPTRVVALKLKRTPAAIAQKASIEGISLKPTNQSPYGTKRR